ncbi:MAG: hypothetical protein SGBAC_001894 [Bacillariaceae sp.]
MTTPTSSPTRSSIAPSPMVQNVDTLVVSASDASTFEEIMKERNRVRKEREEYSVAELRVQISRLEDALAAETKRRVDATTSLDDMAREQIFAMEERLREQMKEDNHRLENRLHQVETHMEELEYRWKKDSEEQLEAVAQKSQEFEKAMKSLQSDQDTERKARLRREGNLLQQVEHHVAEFEVRWKLEKEERENRVRFLEDHLDQQMVKRREEENVFQDKVREELELLQRELDEETMERKAQDAEIVEALNRYTMQLQQSLNILSSD